MDYPHKLAKIDYEVLEVILDHEIESVLCKGLIDMNNELKDLYLLKVRLLNTQIDLEQRLKDENHEPL